MNIDGTNVVQLTFNTADDDDPYFSPDDEFIVFNTDRDGNSEIYIMTASGESQQNITNHSGKDGNPSWSN